MDIPIKVETFLSNFGLEVHQTNKAVEHGLKEIIAINNSTIYYVTNSTSLGLSRIIVSPSFKDRSDLIEWALVIHDTFANQECEDTII